MDKNKLEQLKKMLELANRDTVSSKELIGVVKILVNIIKKENKATDESIARFESRLQGFISQERQSSQSAKNSLVEGLQSLKNEIKTTLEKAKADIVVKMPIVPDIDLSGIESDIETLKKVKPDTPVDVRTKLASLENDERLDISAIKGIEVSKLSDDITNRALGIVDQRTSYLIQSVSNLREKVDRMVTGGSGSITGTDTQVLFFDGNDTPAGDAGFTYNKTTKVITVGDASGGSITGLVARAGATDFTGNGFEINSATAVGNADGGPIQLTAGDGGDTGGAGGPISLYAGDASFGNNDGGIIYLLPGSKSGSGVDGDVRIIDPASQRSAIFDTSSLATTDKTFTFPNASGTLVIGGGTASGTNTGDQTLPTRDSLGLDTDDTVTFAGVLLSGLTASQIVITDSSKNLVSAAVATYPSLTELTYVKGVTSAIQTQLGAKVATTGNETIAGVKTFSSDPIVPDEAYGAGWNGSLEVPTKNAVYDKIETLSAGTAYRSTRMGWAFPDDNIDPEADILANKWHTLSAMWYELEADGDFLKRDSSTYGTNFYYTAANALIVRENATVALVNISSGSATAVNALTASSTKRGLLITEMLSFCQTNNFDGVDLDLETFQTASMSAAQWLDFKTLVMELGNALHAEGLILSIELPPVWNTVANGESGSGDEWDSADSEAYYRLRYAELNDLPVDQVVIMAYDYQYDYSAGRANQPLKWLKEILNYARGEFNEDRIKIVAGIPSAGYSGTTDDYDIVGRTYDYLIGQTGFGGASRDADSGEIIWANAGTSYALIDDTAIATKVAQAEAVGVFAHALWHIGNNQYGAVGASVIAPEQKKLSTSRPSKRTGTTTSSATPTINTDTVDFYSITAQTEAITSFTTNLTGQPTEGQTLWIAITGTAARAITWGASFEASTVALPTTTVTTARLDVGFVWNTVTNKWRCVATC